MDKKSPFIDTRFLFDNLDNPRFSIVDASWHMPGSKVSALENFISGHIPGAVYFDLDRIADTSSDLPHMVAPPQTFSRMAGDLGISEKDTIVVYDSAGLFSAARVWWNFSIMGAENCFVLRGGFPKWQKENRPVATGEVIPRAKTFNARTPGNLVAKKHELEEIVAAGQKDTGIQIVDVRAAARFEGLAQEPRPKMRSGHMPNSINLPFMELIEDGEMIEPEAISQKIRDAGIDLDRPIIASCGSGVTAPILCLALAEIGINSMRVYDGSWSEWGMPGPQPVIGEKGKPV